MTNKLESKILELYHQGNKNRSIARELSIHHNTVKYWLDKNKLKANYLGKPIDMVDEDHARCSKCQNVYHIDNYQYGRKSKNYQYRFSYCNECRKKQSYLNLNNGIDKFLNDKYNRLINRCKKTNIICDISLDDFKDQFYKQEGKCFYCDEEMICKVGQGKHRNSISVDKIIPQKGYVKNNFVFAINKINTCKNDLSLEEIEKWMPDWYDRIIKFTQG